MKTFIATVLSACAFAATAAVQMETVFEDDTYQLTGVAVSKSGRLFTNYPRWAGPYSLAVVEIKDGRKVPFPDAEWNRWDVRKGGDKLRHFIAVQAVVIDDEDVLWVVDPGYRENLDGVDKGQKLVKVDLRSNEVARVYPLSSVAGPNSYLNDIRVDTKRQIGYITNSGDGGIVVVDFKSGQARQVLNGRDVVLSDRDYYFTRRGVRLFANGRPYRANADGIALTPDRRWLYFKALTDDRLFRVPTSVLADFGTTEEQVYAQVEFLGRFTTTDGMEFDSSGNLYLGDLERRRLMKVTPRHELVEVIPANESVLTWPDSYQFTADGEWLYVSFSKIDDEPRFHEGQRQPGNFKIMRFRFDR